MKQQTVAAFIDTSGAYDNVLIDILCNILIDNELPSGFQPIFSGKSTRVFRWWLGIHDTGWIQGPFARIST
jgi:hypothetical protein